MNSDNRLLLAILVVAVALLLVVCIVGSAFVLYFYQSTATPGSSLVPAAPAAPERSTPTAPRKRPADTLILRAAQPTSLDPHLLGDADSAEYVVHIFGGLVRIDENLRLQPDLAESWTTSADGRVYTFTLRQNARFHDGRQVTAQDVKYSFERALNPATGSDVAIDYLGDIVGARERRAGRTNAVEGVAVIDDRTV